MSLRNFILAALGVALLAGAVLFLSSSIDVFSSGNSQQDRSDSGIRRTLAHTLPAASGDNIVFILVDTLRADHLPFHGYPKDTAPFLSQLAREGVVFERAFSVASSTAPAMASIFTSMLPTEHGVRAGKMITKNLAKTNPSIRLNRIPHELTTLPEHLKQAGFRTFGVADNLNICREMGFDQGFDRFQYFYYRGAPRINQEILSWSDDIERGGPTFIYLHYMDPHQPYHRREPFFQKGATRQETRINAYDSEIRYVDQHIEELFQRFRWKENSLVVFLSDHGEEFWDHGGEGHGKTLYTEVTHVPFFIYHRSLTPRRIAQPVSSYDLLPTIISLLGGNAEPQWRGIDLSPLLLAASPAETQPSERPIYQELVRHAEVERERLRGIIGSGMHIIVKYALDGTPGFHLFDLNADFKEMNDLIDADHPQTQSLIDEVRSLEQLQPFTAEPEFDLEVDEESIEQLRTLGYVR